MNKKVLFMLPWLLISGCKTRDKDKVAVKYAENCGFIVTNKESYPQIFNTYENILTIFSIKDASYCASCINVSLSNVEQYTIDHHFNIYHYEFNLEEENWEQEYNDLVTLMNEKNDIGLSPLSYEDDLPIISDLPCLMFSSLGYIGYKVTTNFVEQLEDTIIVKKDS